MKFTLQHARDLMGQRIDVQVTADDGETINSVTTTLDGIDLANDNLDPPSVSYQRTFDQAGSASPGMDHTLIVRATNDKGNEVAATSKWRDAN